MVDIFKTDYIKREYVSLLARVFPKEARGVGELDSVANPTFSFTDAQLFLDFRMYKSINDTLVSQEVDSTYEKRRDLLEETYDLLNTCLLSELVCLCAKGEKFPSAGGIEPKVLKLKPRTGSIEFLEWSLRDSMGRIKCFDEISGDDSYSDEDWGTYVTDLVTRLEKACVYYNKGN